MPVLVQLVAAVGLVGYLSFRNGQDAVEALASQLRREVSARIKGELAQYFGDPHAINRLNATAFSNGDLDIKAATEGEHLLFQQMKIYSTIAFVYCGSVDSGQFFGILRSPETGQLRLSYGNASNGFRRQDYSLDVRGYRQHYLGQAEAVYDARTRPWFQAAIASEQPVWTDVYLAFSTGLPNITASLPVYDRREDNRLLGVCGTDVVLPEEFRNFLKAMEIGRTGHAFVIDRQGNLISSSTDEPLMTSPANGPPQFLQAVNSNEPLVRESASYLSAEFGSFDRILRNQQLTFLLNGRPQFLEVLPFRDRFGLDWLIVVVVPKSDYMGQILHNTRMTIGLCIVAVLVALGIGILMARRVTTPIVELNAAVKEISQGHWQQRVDVDRQDEVGQLADSVNGMAAQIQRSFRHIENQRNAFSRFFPPEYLELLGKRDVTAIERGDHVSRDMAVMFSDIREFTHLAESLAAREVFDFINRYLHHISPEVRNHNGFVVKFIGDGVMAVFPDSVEDAIESAIAQFAQIQQYNQTLLQDGYEPIRVGMGLHAGRVMAGMVGDHDRIQPDAVSDTVNLAARLEGLSKLYGAPLIISDAVRSRLQVRDRYQLRFLDQVVVKGRTGAISIYDVLDAEQGGQQILKQETVSAFEAGIQAYHDQDLTQAEKQFADVLMHNPADKTAQLYQQRIHYLVEHGIPDDWTGIWVFDQKR